MLLNTQKEKLSSINLLIGYFKYLFLFLLQIFTVFSLEGNSNHTTTSEHMFHTSEWLNNIAPCASTPGCIGGNVFKDFNCNGVNDTSELGIQDVEINIFDCNNALIETVYSDVDGDWEICGLLSGINYRAEFNLSDSLQSAYNPSHVGLDNNSNVQYSESGNCINFGLVPFTEICTEDVTLLTSCYNFGGSQGQFKDNDAFVGVVSNKINDPTIDAAQNIIHYATHEQIGTTYGLAVDQTSNKAYVASYMKRHAGFGPAGTGAIYEIDLTNSASPTVLADLNSIYGANTAGVNPHDYSEADGCINGSGGNTNFACWFNDIDSWEQVGMTSLGDMDISDDNTTLFVMNLEDRNIYPIDLTNPTAVQIPFAFPLDQDTDPNVTLKPRDAAYDVRPFALKFHNGLVYVAAVDSERSRHRDNICCSKGGSVVYVYSLNPITGQWTLVLEEDIQRGGPGSSFFVRWNIAYQDSNGDQNHMIVSDIEFDGDDIVLGLRDLSADKYGNQAGKPIAGDGTLLFYDSKTGDIVRFCYDSGSGTYNFENNGSCGGVTTSGANSNYGWPESPSPRGSYYSGDFYNGSHPQTSLGGLWLNPVDNRLYSTVYDLNDVFQGGIKALDNTTGEALESYILIADTRPNGGFGKAAGLGDIEAACPILPLEIGNYVWCDSIENGIQDACERGIDNMIVQIYDEKGLLVGQDTTISGNYYFNQNNVDVTGVTVDGNGIAIPMTAWTGMSSSTQYFIVFGSGQFTTNEFTVGGNTYGITPMDNTGSNENIDSDVDGSSLTIGSLGARPNGLPFIDMTTNTIGCGDHKYDLGVTCIEFDWGDLPDSSAGTGTNNYETSEANNGPVHQIVSGLFLGASVDAETDGQPSFDALGDGADEDGTAFASNLNMSLGNTITVPLSVTNTTGSTAYLEAWIDWNGDGDFNDLNEMILNLDDGSGTFPSTYQITIPDDAVINQDLGVRYRLSNTDDMTPYGLLNSGEVEDYLIQINCKPYVCLPINLINN